MDVKIKKQQTSCRRVNPFHPDCFPVDFFKLVMNISAFRSISTFSTLGNNERVYLCSGS